MTEPTPKDSRMLLWLVVGGVAFFGLAWFGFSRSRPQTTPAPNQEEARQVDRGASPPESIWLRDVTHESDLNFTYRNGEEAGHFSILETLGGGIALIDYDNDGLLDIFVTGGGYFDGPDKKTIRGYPCKLFRNLGHFKFEDVTEKIAFGKQWFYSHGIAVADYDRDGFPDLLVTGYGKIALFHNIADPNGGRRFEDVTDKVGLKDTSWCTSAAWGDLDGDGYPDLYICHYIDWSFSNNPECKGQIASAPRDVCPPQRFKPLVHAVFRNVKGVSFEDMTVKQGFKAVGCGLGVVMGDLNDDGRPDIYVGNDASNNFLFFNRPCGILDEKGGPSYTDVNDSGHYDGSMGVDIGDYDSSGRPSIMVTNFQGDLHALYRNLGNETFQHSSRATGIGAIGMHYVGFGVGFFDVDNDGWEDLVIANGHVLHHPMLGSTFKQRPVLLHNVEFERRRFFKEISPQGGPFFQTPALGRGLAIGDLDNDGWPDLVVSHTNSPIAILRNEAAKSNPTHRWLGIQLAGLKYRDVVGSTIILETATGDGSTRKQTRFAKGGGSYLSSGDRRLLFGLGATDQIKRLTVKWSWGETESWDNLEPNAYWELQQGEKAARRITYPRSN